jgi:signal transduction histidine kinase
MRAILRLLVLFLAFTSATSALAQTPKPVQAAIDKARATMVSDPAEGLRLSLAAEALAGKMPEGNDRRIAIATARWLRSEAYLRQDNAKAAAPLIATTLRDVPDTIKLRGDLLLSLGSLQMDDGKAARALDSYLEALRIFHKLQEKRSESLADNYLAGLYSAGNDNQTAVDYYESAMKAYSGDPALSLALHHNRGNVLLLLDKYAKADAEYAQALKLAQQIQSPVMEANVLGNMARNQLEWGHLDAAEKALERGFALTRNTSASDQRRFMLATAARVAADRKNYPLAERLIRECFKGVDLATTSGQFRTPHLYAYQIFSATGQPALALKHLEAVRRITDESSKVATTTAAALAAAHYNSEGQKAQIANMRADAATKSAAFQRTLFFSIGSATLIVIAALAWGLVTIRRSRNKVAAANVVLGETNVALEKALKAKTEFLATTSHEIRTPLNGILGMTQVMLHDQKLDAATRDRIGIVHGAGVTMRSLVDDILDVAKMETGNLVVDAAPMDLCAMLKEVTRLWNEQARAKGLAFNLHLDDAPHWIVSDSGRLRQIVFNLLSNAIKFTESGGVTLRVAAEGEGDARRLRLAVTDTGIGIPPEKREEIFESFKQADSGTTRQFGGTGLGLTICRNLARALGGDIHVEGAEGHGSVFIVDLPLVAADAPEAEAASGAAGTMLILDRNPIARSMLKTLLEPHVGTLRFLATPDEVLAALGEPGVSQLVIDEGTLKAAGDEPLAILARLAAAATENGAGSAILWLKPDAETNAALLDSGITQVIEKPVSGAVLIEALISSAEENSDKPGSGPLVSRAA